MNGEIPSVPITTLAGISSLTDLLPEMPLPSPLPQTLSNKSLLFHPRVAEEAQILLSVRDEALVPQLIQSLVQTSSDHIELKDHYAGTEHPAEHQQNIPELLKAILQRNPSVFKGPSLTGWTGQTTAASLVANSHVSPGGGFGLPQQQPQQPQAPQQQPPMPPNISVANNHVLVHSGQNPQSLHPSILNPAMVTPNLLTPNLLPSPSHLPQQNTQPPQILQQASQIPVPFLHSPSPNHMLIGGNQHPRTSVPMPTHPVTISSGLEEPNDHMNLLLSGPSAETTTYGHTPYAPTPTDAHQAHLPPHPQPTSLQPQVRSSSMHPIAAPLDGQQRLNCVSLLGQNRTANGVIDASSQSTDSCGVSPSGSIATIKEDAISSSPRTQASHLPGSSPAQAAVAPVPPTVIKEPIVKHEPLIKHELSHPQSLQPHLSAPQASNPANNAKMNPSNQDPGGKMKIPIVRLNRLSAEDQALMQKSLTKFAEKSPNLASKLGITVKNKNSHHIESQEINSESDSEDDRKKKPKYFKAREKEREIQRQKEREKRKKKYYGDMDDETNDAENDEDFNVTSQEKAKRQSRCNINTSKSNLPAAQTAEPTISKPKLRKIEKKLVKNEEKLSIEELMETNTYQRFNRSIDSIFENTEDLDLTTELDDEADVPAEALIPKYQLQDLCSEAAKLKTLGAMESIPAERIVRLLNILEKNIRDGIKVSPIADPDDDEDESKLWLELTMERVMRAADASLTALYIMTSANMAKQIYLEDVIDRVVSFTKYQLHHTIYPSFDPVYRVDHKGKDHSHGRKKHRGHGKEVREKSILTLYNKLHELVSVLSELLHIQVLTDTAVLHASSMGVAPFFVESVSELQLSALRLVTVIFTKYEKHRRLLLDDILASIARLPSSKRSLRTYRLNSEEHIQMLTALVLQLIQCVVALPENFSTNNNSNSLISQSNSKDEEDSKTTPSVDRDVLIVNKYETATMTAANFLTVFLNKCGSKSEEIDYRPLFENFVQDLLTTVNKPEWPATELLLSLLGKLLVNNFSNKSVDMSLRVASLDYLGVVAARLRKDAVVSHLKIDMIDQIIHEIKIEESRDEETPHRKSVSKSEPQLSEEERTQFLQRVLLDYLAVTGQNDPALYYSRHFYIAQWYRDATVDRTTPSKPPRPKPVSKEKGRRKRRGVISSDEEDPPSSPSDKEEDSEKTETANDKSTSYRLSEQRKHFLISKIKPFQEKGSGSNRVHVSQTYIDYCNAELISRYLASKRSFSKSFDLYLKQILCVLTESSIAIRTKALKCLTMVVEADAGVLARLDMQTGVRHSFLDHATSVREAAVDLVGKFVLSRPELIDKYYGMLLSRILDTGVSVRKRVIKILKDICIECPEFPKIPEICVKMIRRVNDEEGIRKLVMEVFQNMWFTPVRERPQQDHATLLRKVMNITNVVAASKEIGLEWFEQLLLSLFKPKEDKEDSTKVHSEPPKPLLTACKQIVDCLIENVLRLEEAPESNTASTSNGNGNASGEGPSSSSGGSSQRLVACLTTLYLFAKIRPQLLVNHAITLQPYLSLKCLTKCDYELIGFVARTLELVVPLMEHPSETFLAQLEEDSVKLILQHDKTVVASCLSCLGSVVNNVTRNFKLIRDCFQKYYGHLTDYKNAYQLNPDNPNLIRARPFFRRALYTVGLLLRHFDFMDKDVIQGLPDNIKDLVFETFIYFVQQPNEDIQTYTLKAIGSLCIRYYDFMLGLELKALYHKFLTSDDAPLQMRTQVLNNIEMYLDEEERRMIKQDREWAKLSKQENLKEMGDVSSGMASTIIQVYLKEILESFLNPDISVRHAALKVIQLILQQGLVHPVQIVPYLICMSTDFEKMVSHSADKQLQDIEKKYPGFIHMKSLTGIRLSYKLQRIIQGSTGPVRGFRLKEGEMPGALNGFLYSLLRGTRQQRRGLVLSILKQFDEQVKTTLGQMLYLSDNLAYFPYQVQDEPLFIIHQIDIMISVSGTNLLQAFKEALLPPPNAPAPPPTNAMVIDAGLGPPGDKGGGVGAEQNAAAAAAAYLEEEDEDEDEEVLLSRVPEDTTILQECITASQGCLLLLVLKQHLKDLYGISDAKITQYSPSEPAKIYEKTVNRRSNSQFDPKVTLSKLREEEPSSDLDMAARKALIEQYLDFKQLMLKFDPEDLDDEDTRQTNKGTTGAAGTTTPSAPGHERAGGPLGPTQPTQTGDQTTEADSEKTDSKDSPRVIPKLTIVPPKPPTLKESRSHKMHKSHKSERKKHRHKKKRRKGMSDSENEYSDPDFLV